MQQPDEQLNPQQQGQMPQADPAPAPDAAPAPTRTMVDPDDPNRPVLFAQTNFRAQNQRFGMKLDDRRRHMYVIGKTGMGKSTMLENMIIQDIQDGRGLAVVDPHGDLVEKVLDFVPQHRMEDVIYFNPSDTNNPIAFNILEDVEPEYRHLVVNGLVGVFKKIWADSWGPRLEYILINTIAALMEYPESTLLGVTRMLVDGTYRKRVLRRLTDPMVKSFWVNEFNNYSEKFRNEAIAPIQNKVGQFLSSSLIRNIVGQENSAFDVREAMDSRKIILMNLSKGRIGEENSALLGAMMITKIQLAAMSRVDTPEHERKDFFLYVDEFQNFSTESFAGILSEARKYRLSIIMAHQYIEQLSDEVRAAVFGNVGTMVTFRVGATDAEELEKEYEPAFTKEDLVTLPAYQIYLRLMIDGVASEPFSASTLPPIQGNTGSHDAVIEASRKLYAGNKDEIEDSIAEWSHPDPEEYRRQKKAEAEERAKKEAEEAEKNPETPEEPTTQIEEDTRVNTTGHKLPPLPPQPAQDELHHLRQKHVDFIQTAEAVDARTQEEAQPKTESQAVPEEQKEQPAEKDDEKKEEQKEEKPKKKAGSGKPALHELSEEEKQKRMEEARKKFSKSKKKKDDKPKRDQKKEQAEKPKPEESPNESKKEPQKKQPKKQESSEEKSSQGQQQKDGDAPEKKKRKRRRRKRGSRGGGQKQSDQQQQQTPQKDSPQKSENQQAKRLAKPKTEQKKQSQLQSQKPNPKPMKPGEHISFNNDN